jgi:hypothetical protein
MSLDQQALQIDICNTLLKIGYFNQQHAKIFAFLDNI